MRIQSNHRWTQIDTDKDSPKSPRKKSIEVSALNFVVKWSSEGCLRAGTELPKGSLRVSAWVFRVSRVLGLNVESKTRKPGKRP